MKCTECRLHETCKNVLQLGVGQRTARIMIVQESPYEQENRRGEYMGGKGGRMLRAALGEVGIDLDDVYFTSLVKCSTPEDRLPLQDEIDACKDYLMSEIDVVKPEIIVPTGNFSMKALMGVTAITKHRGKVVEKDGIKYLPILHPNMVLKQPKYMDMFSEDIITLESVLNGSQVEGRPSMQRERRYCETYGDAIDEIKRLYALPAGSLIVLDLETTKANPYIEKVTMGAKTHEMYPESERVKISAIGFSDREGYGSAIPLYHRQTPFTGNQIGTVVKFIRFLLEREDLQFGTQNGKFEIKWLRRQLDIWLDNMVWDSMLMHYLGVTEERGTHGLDDFAWVYTDMGGYDAPLNAVKPKGEDEGNYDLIDWDILKVYLADDCDVTFRSIKTFQPFIEGDEDFKWIWENLMVPASYTLADIEANGLFINRNWLSHLQKAFPEEIKRIEDKMHQFPEVIQMEREWEQLWVERCQIGLIQKKDRTPEQQEKFTKYKKYDPKGGGCTFNFGSSNQLKELLFLRLGLETPILTDKGEQISREGGQLTYLHYSTDADSLKILAKQHALPEILQEFRKAAHLYNNFVGGMELHLDIDGLIHPNYNLHGTVTGRLSSDDPNAQQFPRKISDPLLFQYWHEIKTLFTSRFGEDGVIVQFDYSQLELRILAVFSQDENLIALYRSGADLHKAIAAEAFGITIEQVTKDQRTASKKIQFGVVYQESAKGLSEDLRAEGIEMSVKQCEQFITKYFARFPKVQKWINGIKKSAKREKLVRTLTGRVRHLATIDSTDKSIAAEAERQAVNAPIQSTGSDCTLMSLIIINKWLKESGYRSRICITVHDSIVFDCPKDEVLEVARKVKHIMENLAQYNEKYSFLGDVPIVSEMEIGYSYGASFECTIEELEEQGIDGYLQAQLAKKKEKEFEAYKKAEEKGTKIPAFVRGYWEEYKGA